MARSPPATREGLSPYSWVFFLLSSSSCFFGANLCLGLEPTKVPPPMPAQPARSQRRVFLQWKEPGRALRRGRGGEPQAAQEKPHCKASEISPPKSAARDFGEGNHRPHQSPRTWAPPWEVLIARDLGGLRNLYDVEGHRFQSSVSESKGPGTCQFQNCDREPGGGAVGQQDPCFQPQQRLLAPVRQVSGPYSNIPRDCVSLLGAQTQPPENGCREGAQGWASCMANKSRQTNDCSPSQDLLQTLCSSGGALGLLSSGFPEAPRTGWQELREAVWVNMDGRSPLSPVLELPDPHRASFFSAPSLWL